jgi:hypothetical protein
MGKVRIELLRDLTMTTSKAIYSPEEFWRRGKDIYDYDVSPGLRPEDENKFVAIDIQTRAFEIAGDDLTATDRLLARQPDALIWLARVGQRAAYRIGRRSLFRGIE